jgi:replication factor C subunit 3/5
MTQNTSIPWVEKYRPTSFNNIVLDDSNKTIFRNIISRNYFPNLLFYGPPGTGKTTTIVNLIREYQETHFVVDKSLQMHLNASDERGIDVIRNQLYSFTKSKHLFKIGPKFVILDEVDYMTKNAQQALKYLIQSCDPNIKFCLICNYISKVDESLQNEFVTLRFNQLPKNEISKFINTISEKENIILKSNTIDALYNNYQSDIRSMINFIQLNQNLQLHDWQDNILHISSFIRINNIFNQKSNIQLYLFKNTLLDLCLKHNTDLNNLINEYLFYLLRNSQSSLSSSFILNIKEIVHIQDASQDSILNHLYYILLNHFNT